MKSTVIVVAAFFSIFISCRQQEQLKAKIYERRDLKANGLMIGYTYTVDKKVYLDSASVANVVINSDSILIIIDPSNPGKSIPDIYR